MPPRTIGRPRGPIRLVVDNTRKPIARGTRPAGRSHRLHSAAPTAPDAGPVRGRADRMLEARALELELKKHFPVGGTWLFSAAGIQKSGRNGDTPRLVLATKSPTFDAMVTLHDHPSVSNVILLTHERVSARRVLSPEEEAEVLIPSLADLASTSRAKGDNEGADAAERCIGQLRKRHRRMAVRGGDAPQQRAKELASPMRAAWRNIEQFLPNLGRGDRVMSAVPAPLPTRAGLEKLARLASAPDIRSGLRGLVGELEPVALSIETARAYTGATLRFLLLDDAEGFRVRIPNRAVMSRYDLVDAQINDSEYSPMACREAVGFLSRRLSAHPVGDRPAFTRRALEILARYEKEANQLSPDE